MLDELHEECGVIGIYNGENVARNVAMGLYALQHRGQESADSPSRTEKNPGPQVDGTCIDPSPRTQRR